ncbi:MAG: NHL repeat-containing protein [Thermomicrobiales bacterium]
MSPRLSLESRWTRRATNRLLAGALLGMAAALRGNWPRPAAGEASDAAGSFTQPVGLVADAAGNLLVADFGNNRIQRFHRNGRFLNAWGDPGIAPGQFQNPAGLALESDGALLVADLGNNRLQRFTMDGALLGVVGEGEPARAALSYPFWVVAAPDGTLYITSGELETVQVLAPNGEELAVWGGPGAGSGPGQFSTPAGLAVTRSGDLLIADYQNARIQRLSPEGRYLTEWGTPGDGPGELSGPLGLALGSSGDVFVTDSANARVQVFSADGIPLRAWGERGEGPGEFLLPGGIAVDSAGDVYVADLEGHTVQKFTARGEYLFTLGSVSGGSGHISPESGAEVDAPPTTAPVTDTQTNTPPASDDVLQSLAVAHRAFAAEDRYEAAYFFVFRSIEGPPFTATQELLPLLMQSFLNTIDGLGGIGQTPEPVGSFARRVDTYVATDGSIFPTETQESGELAISGAFASCLGWTRNEFLAICCYVSAIDAGWSRPFATLLSIAEGMLDRSIQSQHVVIGADGLHTGDLWDLLPTPADLPANMTLVEDFE